MASNKNKQTNTGGSTPLKAPMQARSADSKPGMNIKKGGSKKPADWIIAGCVAIVTWLFLKACLDNKFTNWDDPGYVTNNAIIKDISGEGIKNIFSTPIMGNYHPLTILTYAIEYSYVRLEPWLYHFDSLLLHVVVTLLVYWFIKLLTGSQVAAAVTALLFGLHPMHIESVAWLAGRKDVVYGSFYMGACIAYVYYLRSKAVGKWKWYGLVTLLFLCSMLGKPVAVTLPVTLLLVDYFEQRKWDKMWLLEKLPWFAIAVGFGIRSMLDQKAFGSLATQNVIFNPLERIALGGYALITYVWKAVLPVKLSCFYPYPTKLDNSIPFIYYVCPLIAGALIAVIWKFARHNKVVVFGSLFFLVNIALLLQFLPVGGAIVADRYSYIPYVGLCFMAGWLVSRLYDPA